MWYFALIPTYFVWHYTGALRDFKHVSKNILWFIFNFFSIGILLDTVFSPWRRLSKDVDPHSTFFSNLVVNTLMRFVGMFIRLATIIVGTAAIIAAIIVFFAGLLFWLFLPFLAPAMFLYGISFFI